MFIFKLYYNNEKCPKCGFKLSFNQNLSLNLNDLDFENINEYIDDFVYLYCHICKFKQSFNLILTKSK